MVTSITPICVDSLHNFAILIFSLCWHIDRANTIFMQLKNGFSTSIHEMRRHLLQAPTSEKKKVEEKCNRNGNVNAFWTTWISILLWISWKVRNLQCHLTTINWNFFPFSRRNKWIFNTFVMCLCVCLCVVFFKMSFDAECFIAMPFIDGSQSVETSHAGC